MKQSDVLLIVFGVAASGALAWGIGVQGGVGDSSVPAGETYMASIEFEGDCPPGSEIWIAPAQENETVRFWYNVRTSALSEPYEIEVVSGQAYDIRLVVPGQENRTVTWRAGSTLPLVIDTRTQIDEEARC